MYDISSEKSFKNVRKWLASIEEVDVCAVLLGCHPCDFVSCVY